MNKKYLWICIVILAIIIFVFILSLIIRNLNDYSYDDLFTEISYDVPSKFEKDDDYIYSKYYNYSDNSVYCSFSINVTEKDYYDDVNDWFKGNIRFNLNDKISELKEITLHDNKALYVDKKSSDSTEYYYGMESSNYYYLLKYSIDDSKNGDRNDLDSNLCYNAKDRILSSVNIK